MGVTRSQWRTPGIHGTKEDRAIDGGVSLRKEIEAFYRDNKTPIEKLIAVGVSRRGLAAPAIKEAAEAVYIDIEQGLEVRPIRIAWEVFSRAKRIQGATDVASQAKQEHKENKEIQRLEGDIVALRETLSQYKAYCALPWWKRVRRFVE